MPDHNLADPQPDVPQCDNQQLCPICGWNSAYWSTANRLRDMARHYYREHAQTRLPRLLKEPPHAD